MNTLKIYPKKVAESYRKNFETAGIKNPESYHTKRLIFFVVLAVIVGIVSYFYDFGFNPVIPAIAVFIVLNLGLYFSISLKAADRLKKIEDVFPDFIQLMSSNLRAGMTIDKAFLLSARPEFTPLDEEILHAGKEITVGKDTAIAMLNMAKRIGSEKITKTLMLIISGIKSGGNISSLLEQTSSNMREKEFIEKRAASNILMYVIFIFFAVGVGAPILFGLSSILVEIILTVVKTLPQASSTTMSMPFTFRDIGLSVTFIKYFSIIFIIATDLISSLILGMVNKGDEKAGLKYFIPLILMSLAIFFAIRLTLGKSLLETFSALPK
jgi:archaellum biogenesis protein FlaJ (TadC family)